jgi:hypothetical protein
VDGVKKNSGKFFEINHIEKFTLRKKPMAKYGIQNGQYYIAADGSKHGHFVIDCDKFSSCDDVVTKRFSINGMEENTDRIDAFKLAVCRYSLVEKKPEWLETIDNNRKD